METNVGKIVISSATTHTDLVTSPILWQCLYVIRNVPEFQNLSFRVTKNRNDAEVVVVYREGVLGVFGPPLDPITLTLDPKGRCLLTILFKPVQRVCIVSPESGQINIESLLTVLRLIAGKGFLFCPGLPERFLAGKACGKYVVLHKVPFKRFQAPQCPVYYQVPLFQESSNKPSICALCPRCMQVAKLIHDLPNFASNAAGAAVRVPAHLPVLGQLKSDHRNVNESISPQSLGPGQINENTTGNPVLPVSVNRLLSLKNFHSNPAAIVSSESQIINDNASMCQLVSGVDVNGNSQPKVADHKSAEIDSTATSVDTKVKIIKTLLKNLLQGGCGKQSVDLLNVTTEIAGAKANREESSKALNYGFEKRKHKKRNVCRHCKKQFSTPANLLNHLQRHEAMSGSWQKQFRRQKLQRKPSFFSSSSQMFSRLNLPSVINKKKPAHLSETSIRLFLKRLDDMIPSQNGAKCFKQARYSVMGDKIVECETTKGQNSSERPQFTSYEQMENETHGSRSGVKRASSGLSPMQTLLEAAAIAEVDHAEENSLGNLSFFTQEKYPEAAVVSSTTQLPNFSAEQVEVSVPQKKPRKSTRLASKRAKNNEKRTKDDESFNDMVEADNSRAAHEQSMLTNLNLLSTVSLETAMRQSPSNTQFQPAVSNSIPRSTVSPENKGSMAVFPYSARTTIMLPALKDSPLTHPTSKSVGVSQQLLNNTSGGNVVISRPQDTYKPFMNTHLQNTSSLPPLPPLLFAGDFQGKDLLFPLLQRTQAGQHQNVPVSMPSILRSLVTVSSNQPNTSSFIAISEAGTVKNHSPNSDCGAMDLSKPKLPQAKTYIPANIEKSVDFCSLSGLPHNIVQLVAGNENPSEVLQCFMMMSKSAGASALEPQDIKPSTISSDKQADSELQARMFASASNYKIEKVVKKSQQVHSVIASSSRITKPGKGTTQSGGTPIQVEEIQCGYKWSGSGGSVKERTQMVRELVPPDVMANLLTKHQLSNTSQQQLNVSIFSTSQMQQKSPQLVQTSLPGWQTQTNFKDLPTTGPALNLITSKPSETHTSKKGAPFKTQISATPLVISSPSPVQDWSPASPGSMKESILRSSLTNASGILNQLKGRHSNATTQKLQISTLNMPHSSNNLSPSSLTTTPTPPSTCTISSPSLAAMLRQPAANILNISVGCVTSVAQRSSLLSLPRDVYIKAEPLEPYNSGQNAVIMTLPIKAETQDEDVEMVEDEASFDADSSPTNLIVDMGPNKTGSRDMSEKLKSIAVSRASLDMTNKSGPVKCEQRHLFL